MSSDEDRNCGDNPDSEGVISANIEISPPKDSLIPAQNGNSGGSEEGKLSEVQRYCPIDCS